MELQISIDNPQPLTLSEQEQAELVRFVTETEQKGREARKPWAEDWEECRKWYDCEPDPIIDPEMEWQSNLVLPWAYDAVESAYSHLHSTMIPRNDAVYDFVGRTNDDHPGIEVMGKYLVQTMDRARLPEQFGKTLKQLLVKNHACTKVYWRRDTRTSYEWQVGPDGVERRVPVEKLTFNGIWFDAVDVDNFVFYPIHGDIEKSTRIHCTYRFLEDLKAAAEAKEAPYFNIDKLTGEEEKTLTHEEIQKGKKTYQGVKIKEAWIHRVKIGEKVYKNYVAVIADDKHLIRFQPNPYEGGKSPFVWTQFMPNGDCNYSFGLLSRGKNILKAANFLFNQRLDELKLKTHQPHAYWDDGIFNPYNVICRPGAMVEMSQESVLGGNLRPIIQDMNALVANMQEVLELKAEFESVTVPKVVKGLIESNQRSATEIARAENNSTGKLHTIAFHANENHLKPLGELSYMLNYQMIQQDPQVKLDMARVTLEATEQVQDGETGEVVTVTLSDEDLVAKLPEILPLPELDVKVVGYQNAVRKQETAMAMGQAMPQLVQTPAAKYHKWDAVAEIVYEALDVDKDRILMDADERKQADQKEQQAQEQLQQQEQAQMALQVEKEKMTLELKAQEQEQQFALKMRELDLRELELQLRYANQEPDNEAA